VARRLIAPFGISLGLHAVLAGGAVGFALWRGLPSFKAPDLDLVTVDITNLKELPLGPMGAPAAPEAPPADEVRVPAAKPKLKKKPKPKTEGELPETAKDEADQKAGDDGKSEAEKRGDKPDPRGPAPKNVDAYAPEGSRLAVILKLDRLRKTPYAADVDAILTLMPDRNGLLAGTGLDLYRDFDTLFLATPNPMDFTATLLVLRHKLTDKALRDALDRGAASRGLVLAWREVAGRPVGERRSADPKQPTRDDRLFVLPAPGLAVVAPPAYAKLLLEAQEKREKKANDDKIAAAAAKPGDAADGGAGADGGQAVVAVGKAPGEKAAAPRDSWVDLIDRIDAEDGALPENAIAVLRGADFITVAPGQNEKIIERGDPMILGKAFPRTIELVAGAKPSPFLDLRAEFVTETGARGWEQDWPAMHEKLRTNPWVVLSGFAPLIERIEVVRHGNTLGVKETATAQETQTILRMVAGLITQHQQRRK